MSPSWNTKQTVRIVSTVLLLAILGYGGFLRAHDIGLSLYDEEILTRGQAMQPALTILTTQDNPLYDLAARASLVLGDTEATLRLPSFLAGLLIIVAVYFLLRRVHSRTAGLVGAALVAFSPFQIHYSTFARDYAVMMLFALLTAWCLFALLDRGGARAWIGYMLAAMLGLAAHPCFAPALYMMSAGALIYLLLDRGRGTMGARASQALLLLLCTLTASGLLLQKGLHEEIAFSESSAAKSNSTFALAMPESDLLAMITASDAEERPMGGGLASIDPDTGVTRYRLTFFDCLEYLKVYFWNDTVWLWPLLLVFGVWGFVDLWFRVPALAAPLSAGLLLAPLPMFFITSTHWYHARYLSYASVFAVIFVAAGLCAIPLFVARIIGAPRSIRWWHRQPSPIPARAITVTSACYGASVTLLLLAAAPLFNEAYLTYPLDGYLPRGPLVENHAPVRDWKGLGLTAAPLIHEGDVMVYMMPNDEHPEDYTRYYLSRFLPWSEHENHLYEQIAAPTPELLRELAKKHPMANLWFAGAINYNVRDFESLFGAAGAIHYDLSPRNVTKGLELFLMGAPTTNLVLNGSFEDRLKVKLPVGLEKSHEAAYAGVNSLKLSVTPAEAGGSGWGGRFHTVAIGTAAYRLRNNGFDAWDGDWPVAWKGNEAAQKFAGRVNEGFEATSSLRLAPPSETIVLQQRIDVGLAPGHTVEVQAMGLSSTPGDLQLVLRFAGPGFQDEVRTAHPGTGAWEQMAVATLLPANVDPASIIVEVWRTPGGEGDALVDKVELRVNDAGASLDPGKTYVVSLAARAEDLETPGRVRIAWTERGGKTGHRDLIAIENSVQWEHRSAVIRPGVDMPAYLEELHLELGLPKGSGAIWVDGVQLEEGSRPSLFTETFRLPHDEAIDSKDLAPHAVTVSW